MAAIGKIRSWGPVLVGVIALALFAFIAEEAVRSCESSRNDQRQQVGQVLGEKISVQDFQKLVDEYSEVMKMQQGTDNLNEQQLNQVKDAVWNTFVQTRIIENEAKKLGLTVTDEEVVNVLKEYGVSDDQIIVHDSSKMAKTDDGKQPNADKDTTRIMVVKDFRK